MSDAETLRRMEMLEETVESLKILPEGMRHLGGRVTAVEIRLGDVESQVVQLRGEMRDGFSAVRRELREDIAATARESVALHLESQRQIADVRHEVAEARSQARMMFEEIVSRLKSLGES